MRSSKRSRTSDNLRPGPSHKSSRITRASSTAVPTIATASAIIENVAVPTADTANTSLADDPNSPQDSSSSKKTLSNAELLQQVLNMVKNRERAELMVLELMDAYSFSFLDLKDILREHNLNVSFSNVKYVDIAPKVGLKPFFEGEDIPTFPMYRARLTNDVFKKIIENLEDLALQYGDMSSHRNEEARSRFISGFFNKTVALFSGALRNTPETLLEGRFTSKGRMEYQFKAFGGITILFIEVKIHIGTLAERLNFYAQVIAECDACAWMNFQNGFHIPITAILCDGRDFIFFNFVDRRPTRSTNPQFSIGKFADGNRLQSFQRLSRDTDPDAFIRQARPLCEALFYVFLDGYRQGLDAYWDLSIKTAKKQGGERPSTPGWVKAKTLAKEALNMAVSAWDKREENREESKQYAKTALDLLTESSQAAPLYIPTLWNHYTEEAADNS